MSHVNYVSGRLSLRPPQRQSLEILDRVAQIAPPSKEADANAALEIIKSEYPSVTSFEREFPSLCFALATGVGKTRLMGAFISYLHLAHGISDFFVLAPNLTIYNKLIADFTPNTPKYVFRGISEFAVNQPAVITGDNYESQAQTLFERLIRVKVNIFNISKINSEVRGGKPARIKRMAEYLGQSYFDYLARLPKLVLLMDESHRYRADAGVRAINELKPVLGLELTATPFTETSKGAIAFKNVVYDYPLAKAMEDGFVKEPAVVTRKDFQPAGMKPEQIEQMKLEDGVRLHEATKVELETYARTTEQAVVKPFMLVIARDTTHAASLLANIQSDSFFAGRYRDKVIQVDSSKTGKDEEEMISRLLKVEQASEPTEIVIHVNMLKEGWDVTNLYTIVPLRAANARILIEQSIGRGLRLPCGKRTGVEAVDTLNIVAHDKFREIVDEANRPDSVIRLKQLVIDPSQLAAKKTVVAQSTLATQLGFTPPGVTDSTTVAGADQPQAFIDPAEQKVAQIAFDVIRRMERNPDKLPAAEFLKKPEIQAEIVKQVEEQQRTVQREIGDFTQGPDPVAIVAKTTELYTQQTISIPRILVQPKGDIRAGFKPFTLELTFKYPAPSDELFQHFLRENRGAVIASGHADIFEQRPEDYIVSGLLEFNDVSYEENAELLYDLAAQTVRHFDYLKPEEVRKVLIQYQRPIAEAIYAQMQAHYWEDKGESEVTVSRGFTELKPCAFSAEADQDVLDFKISPADKSNMAKYLFGGFKRCLYPVQKFHSDPERMLAVVLDRDAQKWFRPVKGQFQIHYRHGIEQPEYQPDFVAEDTTAIYMLEPKRKSEMADPVVLAKKNAAVEWCKYASDHSATYNGKPWKYVLIPHDAIATNSTILGLARQFVAT